MNLAIDLGNSWAKCGVMDNGQAVEIFRMRDLTTEYLDAIFESYPGIDAAIMTASRSTVPGIQDFLRKRVEKFILFDPSVPVPIKNLYETPHTLGSDRLAAAVAANAIYPANNILVVDFGTAITIDLVSDQGEFLGGNISPGASIRFKALHEYTSRLPLLDLHENENHLGRNSKEAIENGVINGIVYEIDGYIRDLDKKIDNLKIIFTGGESNFFVKRFKNTIFANYDLVVYGLNRILEYNAE